VHRVEGDEEVVRAGQPMLGNVGQHLLDQPRIARCIRFP
jgi:hypothetical protein